MYLYIYMCVLMRTRQPFFPSSFEISFLLLPLCESICLDTIVTFCAMRYFLYKRHLGNITESHSLWDRLPHQVKRKKFRSALDLFLSNSFWLPMNVYSWTHESFTQKSGCNLIVWARFQAQEIRTCMTATDDSRAIRAWLLFGLRNICSEQTDLCKLGFTSASQHTTSSRSMSFSFLPTSFFCAAGVPHLHARRSQKHGCGVLMHQWQPSTKEVQHPV